MSLCSIIFVHNFKYSMLHPEIILMSAGVLKSLLLILPPNLVPEENFEEWLNDDGFSYSPEKYGDKKFIFDELEKVKNEFRQIRDMKIESQSFMSSYNLLNAHKIRISKLRLIINHEVSYVTNLHARSGIKYVIARTYWIDNNGKKVRRFSKNLGSDEKVYVNGLIPEHLKIDAEKDLDRVMWENYRNEYKE